jgi:hypothetical protein
LGWIQHEISDGWNGNEDNESKDLEPSGQQQEHNNRRNTADDPSSAS